MSDIIYKKHDDEACKSNCLKNSRIFHQAYKTCTYFSNFEEILRYKKVKNFRGRSILNEEESQAVVDFRIRLVLLKDMKEEIELNCRDKEDASEAELEVTKM